MTDFSTPIQFGELKLKNRVVMAPLTRNRATADRVPTPMMAEYYAQRASAGLIISEATVISEEANGYLNTPGLFTDAQVEGWKNVTHAVHAKDGLIIAQLWHVGRVSHPDLLNGETQSLQVQYNRRVMSAYYVQNVLMYCHVLWRFLKFTRLPSNISKPRFVLKKPVLMVWNYMLPMVI